MEILAKGFEELKRLSKCGVSPQYPGLALLRRNSGKQLRRISVRGCIDYAHGREEGSSSEEDGGAAWSLPSASHNQRDETSTARARRRAEDQEGLKNPRLRKEAVEELYAKLLNDAAVRCEAHPKAADLGAQDYENIVNPCAFGCRDF